MPPLTPRFTGALSRRAALQWLAASAAGLAASCAPPDGEVFAAETVEELPYARMPEGVLPGIAQRYATALPLAGYGRGALVTSYEGRPIKVEGNPRHPASLGAADAFAQAEILSLYDPDRSQAIRLKGEISNWLTFRGALAAQLARGAADRGGGLRLLTGRVSSPTLLDQIDKLRGVYPAMRWHVFEPSEPADVDASLAVYGKPLSFAPQLGEANVTVVFDADPLGPGADQVRFARALSDRRRRDRATTRLYAAECAMTLTGAAADHRLAAGPDDLEAMVAALAAALGAPIAAPTLGAGQPRFIAALAKDIGAAGSRGLVFVGPTLPRAVPLGLWINDRLGAPIDAFDVDPRQAAAASLAELADDLAAGKVETLIIVDANPLQTAPGDLNFAPLLDRAPFRVHLGRHFDETGAASTWHLPSPHPLESWSDLAIANGPASVVQPLIAPLYESVSAHRLIGALAGEAQQSDYDRVRATWRSRWSGQDFDARWRQALVDGVIADAAPTPIAKPTARFPGWSASAAPSGLSAIFRIDPSVFDGRFANNAWLQECPQPFSKSVWGNAVEMAPADAKRLGLDEGAEVELAAGSRSIQGPLRFADHVATGVVALSLGYGRRRCGAIGDGVGFDVAPLQPAATPFVARGLTLRATGVRGRLPPSTAGLFALEGEAEALAPAFDLGAVALAATRERPSFNTPAPTLSGDPYAWGMVVDTGACIGCNACLIACQSENNVPVIGPEEIAAGRDMHWLRVDIYNHGGAGAPQSVFQPVPCMQCEAAPCEPVCPVEASVHDHEGLNVQVYNRCVGTRFCESNCPYKVRRFNFFGYADGQEFGNLGDALVKAANNPEVSIRARGVMEKCTYCVQRISAARRAAERESRTIADGEIVTACQAACPSLAIHFGNLADPNADVSALRREPTHYTLLDQLNTRPRTTYLARLRNPNPELGDAT